MSNFPTGYDDDISLPRVDDNVIEIGSVAINAIRSSMFAVEACIGLNAAGTKGTIAAFLAVAHNPDGTLSTSALLGLLTTISITDAQVSATAAIKESKIALTHSTASLFTLIAALQSSTDVINNFISLTGIKVEPHIAGTAYNHNLSAILVDPSSQSSFTNRFATNRNFQSADTLLLDISADLTTHEQADGTSPVPANPQSTFQTTGGKTVPSNFAHSAAGIHIDTSGFDIIPPQNTDLQSFAEEVDLLLGGTAQSLAANGIVRSSRVTSLTHDGYAASVVPVTPVTAFLLGVPPGPRSSQPVDDISIGDDVVLFDPTAASLSTAAFDAAFAQVRPGDVLTINYGQGTAAQFAIDSVKQILNGQTRIYAVRIIGKNLHSSTTATAQIDRSPFNTNKYGVVSVSRSAVLTQSGQNAIGDYESLTVSTPRGAAACGIGFDATQFDPLHYRLYLTLYPTGQPSDGFVNLPGIDVTGNRGATPGAYTLDSIVTATNLAFRAPGFNYRFVAFEYQGSFGIALADSYNNAAFSIIGNTVDGYGNQQPAISTYANNVVDGYTVIDPLGLGIGAAQLASPPYTTSYLTPEAAASAPTLIFYPQRKNFVYVDGIERDSLRSDPNVIDQIVDQYGDGYWPATITNVQIGGQSISTTYTLPYDITTSGIRAGKTIVIQPAFLLTDSRYQFTDYGRFTVKNVSFSGCDGYNPVTTITVYDAVHATGTSPYATSSGIPVHLYFSDDSVGFDAQNVSDSGAEGNFRRFFEVYCDENGHTFTHERARFLIASSHLSNVNLTDVSPKLRGYPAVGRQIDLNLTSYQSLTGVFDGYLSNGLTNLGPTTLGKQGETVRFYDETNIDFIEVSFNLGDVVIPDSLSVQLFPSLQLDQSFFLLATCQVDDSTKLVSQLTDRRQFGNISEQQLSDSAISLIESAARYTDQNGVIRGLDYVGATANQLSFRGGVALVSGRFVNVNNFSVEVPLCQDFSSGVAIEGILWACCINRQSEVVLLPLTDYNPSVNPTNLPGRQFSVYNLSTLQSYPLDSSTFTTVVDTRKDLTVIALIDAQVSGASAFTLSVTDARKFATDVSANLPMVLTSQPRQGNFHSLAALTSWATYNASMQSRGVVRGAFQLISDPNLTLPITLQGDGQASLSITSSLTINGTNLDSLTLNVAGGTTVSNAILTNCTIICTSQMICGSNVSFIGCTFVANLTNQIPSPIGLTGTSANVSFDDCQVSYTPSTTGTTYQATNLINSGYGFIYCPVVSLTNLTIRNCRFTTQSSTRFSFVNLEFGTAASLAQNIRIEDNRFANTSAVDDPYAAVSLNCTYTVPNTFTSQQPSEGLKLIGCHVSRNLCDKNQLISLTGTPNNLNVIVCSVVPVGCVISDNLCGAIGLTTAAEYDRNYQTNVDSIAYSQNASLTVSGNSCRLIASLTSSGQYMDGSTTTIYAMACVTSGIHVTNNNCAWVHLTPTNSVNSYDQQSLVSIRDNTLRGYNSQFLTQYGDASNIAIGCAGSGSFRLSGNVISTGRYLTSTAANVSYDYQIAIQTAQGDYQIDGNTIAGLQTGNDMIQLRYSVPIRITGNRLIRGTTVISSYVNVTSGGSGAITGNTFDQTTINGTLQTPVIGTLAGITVAQNTNQVGFTSVDSNSLSWLTNIGTPLTFNQSALSNAPGQPNYSTVICSPGSSFSPQGETDLQQFIPIGARLTYAAIGIAGSSSLGGSIHFTVNQTTALAFTPPTFTTVGYAATFTSSSAAIVSAGAYASLDLSSHNLISTQGQSLTFVLSGSVTSSSAANDYIVVGPVLLRYQW